MTEQTPDTRERILQAARHLFWAHGYNATSISQILKEADARSGSLYYFFPTKEDLLLAVLEWYKANLYPELVDPVFDRIRDPIERVFGILDGYRRMLIMTEFQSGCPIGNLALEVGDALPQARQLLADNFAGWARALELCFQEAEDRLPAGVSPKQLATFALTTMEGGIMLSRSYHSIAPFEESVAAFRDYVDRLLDREVSWGAREPERAAALATVAATSEPAQTSHEPPTPPSALPQVHHMTD